MRVGAPHSARYCLFETGLGAFGIAWNGRGVVRLQLPEDGRMATERRLGASASPGEPPPSVEQLVADIRGYLAGKRVDFAFVALDLAAVGEFRLAVYEAARSVAWGQTTSYGELARRIGFPWGARAVGRALARNPVPLIVPCHRILARDHQIGGFSAYGGTVTKRRLLALEGLHVGGTPLSPGLAEPAPTSRTFRSRSRWADRPPGAAGALG
jgi:methylated-DNA-[protein]-cysteine S-methyltransferase